MILTLLTLDSEKHMPSFEAFQKICRNRYGLFVSQPFQKLDGLTWYTALKPFNAVACPYVAMDMMVNMRGCKPRLVYVHDMLDFGVDGQARIDMEGPGFEAAARMVDSMAPGTAAMQFRGFGQRIDIALNALSLLYMDMLATLTQVETDVMHHLRELQYEQYNDPTITRTYGLQKVVAERLGKSPVAIHKSLRSCRYTMMADTAKAMRAIIA